MTMWEFFHEHWFIAWCASWLLWGPVAIILQILKLSTEAVKRIKEPEPIIINDPKDAEAIQKLRTALVFLMKYSYKPRVNSPTYKTDMHNHKMAIDTAIEVVKETGNGQSI